MEVQDGFIVGVFNYAIVPAGEANPFIADLVRLGEALERVRPNARTFVRPGFDEPEAAARLLAGQGGPL